MHSPTGLLYRGPPQQSVSSWHLRARSESPTARFTDEGLTHGGDAAAQRGLWGRGGDCVSEPLCSLPRHLSSTERKKSLKRQLSPDTLISTSADTHHPGLATLHGSRRSSQAHLLSSSVCRSVFPSTQRSPSQAGREAAKAEASFPHPQMPKRQQSLAASQQDLARCLLLLAVSPGERRNKRARVVHSCSDDMTTRRPSPRFTKVPWGQDTRDFLDVVENTFAPKRFRNAACGECGGSSGL